MKIIILGAGQVGTSVAETLADEENDITIVDSNQNKLDELKARLDIRTVLGSASFPDVLQRAGADDADMILALTSSDEINMLACQVAYTLFHTPHKIARVRAHDYLAQKKLFSRSALPIDELINPHQEVTDYIGRLIKNPGALQVLNFADRKARLVCVKAFYGGPLVGHELRALKEHLPSVNARVAAIFRRGKSVVPTGDTVIEADDEVFFIATPRDIRKVMSELRKVDKPYRNIVIVGGGNIGAKLAEDLESHFHLKIIERDPARCEALSQQLNRCVVLQGDAANKELLLDENIDSTDVFCAVTNSDEINIMTSMLAKKLGAGKVLTLINNPAYVDLLQDGDIDIAISPEQITISRLLRYVRRGDIVQVHSLRRGAAEAIEIIARGDAQTSKVVGRRIDEITLPEGTTIGAIARKEEILIAHHDVKVEADDHVILFLPDKSKVAEVERLFQVSIGFF